MPGAYIPSAPISAEPVRSIWPMAIWFTATRSFRVPGAEVSASTFLCTTTARYGIEIPVECTSLNAAALWDLAGTWDFPRLKQGTSTYAVVFPDGSSHEIQQYDNGAWKSVDSTYILLDVPTKTATLKGGTKLVFGSTSGSTSYLTEMKDTNGNKITATYSAIGQLDEVRDTLGLIAKFHYTGTYQGRYVDYIETFGTVHTEIHFSFSSTNYVPLPIFSVPRTFNSSEEKHLRAVRMLDRSLF